MDLEDLDTVSASNRGAFMQFTHPTTLQPLVDEEGKPVGITFAGIDSDIARKHQRKRRNAQLATLQQRRGKTTAEEEQEEGLSLIAACALSWNMLPMGGKVPEFSHEAVKSILRKFPHWREQADVFIAERANFLTDSPTS